MSPPPSLLRVCLSVSLSASLPLSLPRTSVLFYFLHCIVFSLFLCTSPSLLPLYLCLCFCASLRVVCFVRAGVHPYHTNQTSSLDTASSPSWLYVPMLGVAVDSLSCLPHRSV